MFQRRVMLSLAVSVAALTSVGGKPKENPPESTPDSPPPSPADSNNPGDKDKGDKDKDKGDKEKKAEKDNADKEGTDDPITLPEPPADPVEEAGPAPSPHYIFYGGYWRYDFPTR